MRTSIRPHFIFSVLVISLVCLISQPSAMNLVDLSTNCDTLYVDVSNAIQVGIENDTPLHGMSLGFRVWSPDGTAWIWDNVGELGFLSVVEGSRMDPHEEVWDQSGD